MTIEAILLGVAQDAGVPQAGCHCSNCQPARTDPAKRQFVVCLGLVDRTTQQSWLIDATPDFREQFHALQDFAPDCPLTGIILTHAHMGHYTGLIQVGMEAMNAQALPVYATERLANFLGNNAPWSQLVEMKNIAIQVVTPNHETKISPNLRIVPVQVPHRDEFSDTMAFTVKGPARQLFFCPDIDGWDDWDHNERSFMANMDVALLDASFFSAAELPGRDLSKIRHPFVTDTIDRLKGVDCEICLVHLNHSNPLLVQGSERAFVNKQGFKVGHFGMQWKLG